MIDPIIYVSSKLKHKDFWLASGLDPISSWLRQDKVEDAEELQAMWETYLAEIGWSDVFIMRLEQGEVPKGALIEMGIALGCGVPCYIIWQDTIEALQEVVGTAIHHSLVTVVKTLQDIKL